MTSTYITNLRTPTQQLRLRVGPARNGVRLDLGERHVYLSADATIGLANALADALEASKETE